MTVIADQPAGMSGMASVYHRYIKSAWYGVEIKKKGRCLVMQVVFIIDAPQNKRWSLYFELNAIAAAIIGDFEELLLSVKSYVRERYFLSMIIRKYTNFWKVVSERRCIMKMAVRKAKNRLKIHFRDSKKISGNIIWGIVKMWVMSMREQSIQWYS